MTHHYPDVPNLGDFRGTDWTTVEQVDILCGGFPCQPVSGAGARKGVDDERWLFDDIMEEVGRMVARPGLLVFENVLGLLSANGGEAMARVVQGLAQAGYVGRYGVLRASSVGAPHQRARVFIVAADTHGAARAQRHLRAEAGRPVQLGDDAERPGLREPPADTTDLGLERDGGARDGGAGSADGGGPAPTHPHGAGLEGREAGIERGGERPAGESDLETAPRLDWGAYGPAIRRWELILGREAPAPTDAKGRLEPRFVEWLMAFPDGWVTGGVNHKHHLSRTTKLKMLGNAVVTPQAEVAIRSLLLGLAEDLDHPDE